MELKSQNLKKNKHKNRNEMKWNEIWKKKKWIKNNNYIILQVFTEWFSMQYAHAGGDIGNCIRS